MHSLVDIVDFPVYLHNVIILVINLLFYLLHLKTLQGVAGARVHSVIYLLGRLLEVLLKPLDLLLLRAQLLGKAVVLLHKLRLLIGG